MKWNTLRMEPNTLGTELFAFRERNALYALISLSIFPDIWISSHGESAFCLSLLRQTENKSLSHLIRSTCSCVIFFDLKMEI